MKKRLLAGAALTFLVAALCFNANTLLTFWIKKALMDALPESTVQIEKVSVQFPAVVEITGLTVRHPSFIFQNGRILARPNFRSLLKCSFRGSLSAESLSFGKINITAIRSGMTINSDIAELDGLSGDLIGGKLAGNLRVEFRPELRYDLKLTVGGLSVPKVMAELKADKKVEATGMLDGLLEIHGSAAGIAALKGNLKALEGGDVTIKDEALLKDIAARTKQPVAIVKQSFREYHYDTGEINLDLQNNSVGMLVDLNGSKGKRNLNVIFHDVFEKQKGA
jgi:hypothetical protein